MARNSEERELWLTVLLHGVKEALELASGLEATHDRRQADSWVRNGGKDFRLVCYLAGMDPSFIRSNYLNGKISLARLIEGEGGNARGKQ